MEKIPRKTETTKNDSRRNTTSEYSRSITRKELALMTKMLLTFLSASLEFRQLLPHCRP